MNKHLIVIGIAVLLLAVGLVDVMRWEILYHQRRADSLELGKAKNES